MELDEIRELIELMKENQIAEIELEREGEKVRLVAVPEPPLAVAPSSADLNASSSRASAPAELPAPETPAEEAGSTIDSPIVGTFYRSPSPESPPYIDVGDEFDEDTVLCIVEAMKVMNEIKAETKGAILEILVENGQPVEFGQPLFRIQPSA